MEAVRQEEGKTRILLSEGGTFGFLTGRKPASIRYDGVRAEVTAAESIGAGRMFYQVEDPSEPDGREGRMVEIIWE